MYREQLRATHRPTFRPSCRADCRAAQPKRRLTAKERWDSFLRQGFSQAVAVVLSALPELATFSRCTHDQLTALTHSTELIAVQRCRALPGTFAAVVQIAVEVPPGTAAVGPPTVVLPEEAPRAADPAPCGMEGGGVKLFRVLSFLSPVDGGVRHSMQSIVWCAGVHPPAEAATNGSRFVELRYTRALVLAAALVPDPRRVVVLGAGGGTVPMAIRTAFPAAAVDAVDTEPVAVEAASVYLGYTSSDPLLRTHVSDALEYLDSQAGCGDADVVVVDVFGNGNLPDGWTAERVAEGVSKVASDVAVVAVNVVESLLGWDEWRSALSAHFPSTCLVNVSKQGNQKVAVACRGCDAGEYSARASELVAAAELPFTPDTPA